MPQTHKPANEYWFILGRDPKIAAAELSAVLNLSPHLRLGGGDLSSHAFVAPNILASSAGVNAPELIKKLGGTVKIAEIITKNKTLDEIEKIITDSLAEEKHKKCRFCQGRIEHPRSRCQSRSGQKKILFGISCYSGAEDSFKTSSALGLKIKKGLKAQGRAARFVTSKEPTLSSVVVETNHLIEKGGEFILTKNSSGLFSLARTLAVQPYEELSFRDYGRPGRDRLSGMLPPKLAMIMINLSKASPEGTLLDPFCGSGTILSEAMLMGHKNMIASDISERAVSDTQKNIEWIAQKFFPIPTSVGIADPRFCTKQNRDKFSRSERDPDSPSGQIKYQVLNVQNIAEKIQPKSVEAIITEPYLGKPLRGNEAREEILKQADELKNLYLTAFEQFKKILKPGGSVTFIIPRFKFKNEWITINIKNEIEKIGFRAETLFEDEKFLVYSRPDQKVAREIWRFTVPS